jgi:hypothetical protein
VEKKENAARENGEANGGWAAATTTERDGVATGAHLFFSLLLLLLLLLFLFLFCVRAKVKIVLTTRFVLDLPFSWYACPPRRVFYHDNNNNK